MKILATGGNGYIVSLLSSFNNDWAKWTKLTINELDLSKPEQVEDILNQYDFDTLIHAGAMPLTSDCEKYPELTYKVNVLSTIEIAKYCKKHHKKLLFFSSEQVFNGLENGPYNEEVEPLSVTPYGNHKIECEKFITSHLDDYIILRLSWMFGMAQKGIKPSYNLLDKVIDSVFYQKEQVFPVFELRGFTYAGLLADNFKTLLNLPSGIYHFTGDNHLNTYEVAKVFAYYLGVERSVVDKYIKEDLEKYKDKPRDFHMTNTILKENGIDLKDLQYSIKCCLKDYGWLKNE